MRGREKWCCLLAAASRSSPRGTGRRSRRTWPQCPVCGCASSRSGASSRTPCSESTRRTFASWAAWRALQAEGIPLLEADVRPHDRYLMERFITAGVRVEGGRAEGATIADCKLKPAPEFRPVLKVVSLDIET